MISSRLRMLTLTAVSMIAIGPAFMAAVFANTPASESEPLPCKPVPKLLHYEVIQDGRESRYPHQGQVQLSFTIDRTGRVHDASISSSTDDWFNDRSIQSVLRWRYQPPRHTCIATTTMKFTLKD